MKYVVYKDSVSEWRWRFKAAIVVLVAALPQKLPAQPDHAIDDRLLAEERFELAGELVTFDNEDLKPRPNFLLMPRLLTHFSAPFSYRFWRMTVNCLLIER